jgi:hypothetical protein
MVFGIGRSSNPTAGIPVSVNNISIYKSNNNTTDCRGHGSTAVSYLRSPGFKFWPGDRLSCLKFFHGYYWSLKANAGISLAAASVIKSVKINNALGFYVHHKISGYKNKKNNTK